MVMKALLKAGVVGPGLIASTLLVSLMIGPMLPTTAQLTLFYGGLLVVALLAAGVGEKWSIRILFGARTMTEV